ncbi:hypothetical protein PO909_015789 [Leuciscus waleckii]
MEQPENNQTTQAPDVKTKTCQTTPMQEWKNKTQNLPLRATKQTARAISHSMVSTEMHLWLILTGIKDRDRVFLLDASISPSGPFGDSGNTVVSRSREVKKTKEAFVQFLPRHTQGEGLLATQPRPGPSKREAQKQDWGPARCSQQPPQRQDLLTIISVLRPASPVPVQDANYQGGNYVILGARPFGLHLFFFFRGTKAI